MSAPIEREFTGSTNSPADARSFVIGELDRLLNAAAPRPLCDDIQLVVSELVTNAVRAGSPAVTVGVSVRDGRLVIQVGDRAGGWPQPRVAGEHDVTGRGLALVSAVCASWGVRLAEQGKIVWAEVAIPVIEGVRR